jgi:quercetin dioxygenase-like cupin family protein
MKPFKFLLPLALLLLINAQLANAAESAPVAVTTILKSDKTWDGKAISYPQGKAEVTGVLIEFAPGAIADWHSHPILSFGVMLEGELEVQLKNGQTKTIKKGETLMEVVNTLHRGRNVGTGPVKLVMFYTGVAGQSVTAKE